MMTSIAVVSLINDEDEEIRRTAIEILNATKDETAVDHLIKATDDSDWWVRERAVDALSKRERSVYCAPRQCRQRP